MDFCCSSREGDKRLSEGNSRRTDSLSFLFLPLPKSHPPPSLWFYLQLSHILFLLIMGNNKRIPLCWCLFSIFNALQEPPFFYLLVFFIIHSRLQCSQAIRSFFCVVLGWGFCFIYLFGVFFFLLFLLHARTLVDFPCLCWLFFVLDSRASFARDSFRSFLLGGKQSTCSELFLSFSFYTCWRKRTGRCR